MTVYTTPQTNTGIATYSSEDVFTGMTSGGQAALDNQGTVTVTGSTISENAMSGLLNSGTATVVGATISDNSATQGGGVSHANGRTNVANSIIAPKTVTSAGGGVYVQANGVYASTRTTYLSNAMGGASGTGGGAVYSIGTFTSEHDLFQQNYSAKGGGAIYVNNKNVTIDGSTFTNNISNTSGGGAIQNLSSITITAATFTSNTATNYGGAFFANVKAAGGRYTSALTSISQSLFQNNLVNRDTAEGGALYNNGCEMSIVGSTFTANTSNQYGGAVSNVDKTVTVSGASTVFSGLLEISGSTFTSNVSKHSGAAIRNSGTVTMSSCSFVANTARKGGGMYNANGVGTVSNSQFAGNVVREMGGGFSNEDSTVLVQGSTFSRNVAQNGGALSNLGSGVANVSDVLFLSNTASTNGAGIYNENGTVTVQGSTFADNVSKNGGALYNANGTATISRSWFTGNTTSSGRGSAINNSSGVLAVSGSTFTDNDSNGVIYQGNILVEDSYFANNVGEDNSSTGYGSALNQVSGTVSSSTFTQNSGRYGGVAYFLDSVTTVSQNTATDNQAYSAGGFAYLHSNASILASGNVFTANISQNSGQGGGVFFFNGGSLSSTNDYFSNNMATGSGGVILSRAAEGSFTVNGSTFSGNTATAQGGAINNANSNDNSITDALFANNLASNGGAIYNNAYNANSVCRIGVLEIAGSTFTDNTASSGGAIGNRGATTTITGCVFQGNVCSTPNYGCAVLNQAHTATISGTASTFYGTVVIKDSQFLTPSDSIHTASGNTTTLQGTVTACASLTGDGTYVADGVNFVFNGDTAISINNLTETGDGLTGVTFANTGKVTFTSQNLGGKAITVDTGDVWLHGTTTFASGISSLAGATFTVNGEAATLDTALSNGAVLSFASNSLTLTVDFVEVNTPYQDLDEALDITASSPGLITFAEATDGTTCTFSGSTVAHDQAFRGNGATNTAIASADAGMVFANGHDVALADLAWNGILYGGKLGGDSSATDLSFQDAAIGGNVFGGGRANTGGTVADGTVSLAITGSTQTAGKAVYGGGYANGGTATADSVSLTLADVDAGTNSVYGGGAVNNGGKMTASSVSTEIGGGVYGAVYNGANIYSAGTGSSFEAGAMGLEISGGTFTGAVGNGSTPRSGASSVQGASTLAISGGLFQRVVYGGGASFGGNATVDSTTVTVSGGTFNGKVFGGNVGQTGALAASTTLRGNANLTVDSSASDVCFNGNVFGGSMGTGVVGGNVTVTFKGDGSRLHFGASSFVSGASEYAYGSIDYVEGVKTLVFDGFTGDFSANIQGPAFETVTIRNGSAVNVCGGSANQDFGFVSTWNFELGDANAVMITDDEDAANVKNSFYGAAINLTFATGASVGDTAWTVYQGQEATLNYWNELGSLTIGGVAATGTMDGDFMAWSTNDYRVYVDNNYDIRLARLA